MEDFTDTIRKEVKKNNYRITYHAIARMAQKKISEQEITETILCGDTIERDPDAKPYPKCLIMHQARPDKPLYVACGYDGKQARIITAHWRDPKKWSDWWTRINRKRR